MSAFQSNRPVPLGAITAFRLVTLAERAWERFAVWRRARATEAALALLSDAELDDIGLHRGDIAAVAARLSRG